jgi:hypothetical protein
MRELFGAQESKSMMFLKKSPTDLAHTSRGAAAAGRAMAQPALPMPAACWKRRCILCIFDGWRRDGAVYAGQCPVREAREGHTLQRGGAGRWRVRQRGELLVVCNVGCHGRARDWRAGWWWTSRGGGDLRGDARRG